MAPTPERVVYSVAVTVPPVGGGGGTVDTITDITGMKIVPGEIPLLILVAKDGHNKTVLAMSPGYRLDFAVTEILPAVDLTIPSSLIHHDFSQSH